MALAAGPGHFGWIGMGWGCESGSEVWGVWGVGLMVLVGENVVVYVLGVVFWILRIGALEVVGEVFGMGFGRWSWGCYIVFGVMSRDL